MTYNLDRLIESCAEAGANSITVHCEATAHVHRSLVRFRELGCEAGLAFNISTPDDAFQHLTDHVDMLLIMTINPGFGGRSLIPAALPRSSKHAR
jgi:ribulose-phosphate 3-epimerase